MKAVSKRAYSRIAREASVLLGKSIKHQRQKRKLTASDLADRAGITRNTLRKIESGDLSCEIGLAFEVATLVGVMLFDAENTSLSSQIDRVDSKIALLPRYVRKPTRVIDDDF